MLQELSPEEACLVQDIENFGGLQNVNGHLLDQSKGAMVVVCSDGDFFYDIFGHKCEMQNGQRDKPRIHPFSWHAGALRQIPGSPTNKYPLEDEMFRNEISEGHALKGFTALGLDAHLICGKARVSGMSVLDVFDFLHAAKRLVKEENPQLTVAAFLYIAFPKDIRKHEFFHRESWEEWCRKRRHLFT